MIESDDIVIDVPKDRNTISINYRQNSGILWSRTHCILILAVILIELILLAATFIDTPYAERYSIIVRYIILLTAALLAPYCLGIGLIFGIPYILNRIMNCSFVSKTQTINNQNINLLVSSNDSV